MKKRHKIFLLLILGLMWIDGEMPAQHFLENGRIYEHVYPSTSGHQFLVSPSPLKADIVYEGLKFEGVLFNYDIHNDLVFTLNYPGGYPRNIILNEKRIDEVIIRDKNPDLEGMTLAYLRDTLNHSPVGIVEVLFDGSRYKLMLKRKKNQVGDNNPSGGKLYRFTTVSHYILKANGKVIFLRSKKDLLESLNRDPEIISYIRKNKIHFRFRKAQATDELIRVLLFAETQLSGV